MLTYNKLREIHYQSDWAAPLGDYFDAALEAERDEPVPEYRGDVEPWRGQPSPWQEWQANRLEGRLGIIRRPAQDDDDVAVYETNKGRLWCVAVVGEELRMTPLERG